MVSLPEPPLQRFERKIGCPLFLLLSDCYIVPGDNSVTACMSCKPNPLATKLQPNPQPQFPSEKRVPSCASLTTWNRVHASFVLLQGSIRTAELAKGAGCRRGARSATPHARSRC